MILVHAVVIEKVVRAELVEPVRFAGIRVARENSRGPFVVAGPLLGIPRAGIAGPVED